MLIQVTGACWSLTWRVISRPTHVARAKKARTVSAMARRTPRRMRGGNRSSINVTLICSPYLRAMAEPRKQIQIIRYRPISSVHVRESLKTYRVKTCSAMMIVITPIMIAMVYSVTRLMMSLARMRALAPGLGGPDPLPASPPAVTAAPPLSLVTLCLPADAGGNRLRSKAGCEASAASSQNRWTPADLRPTARSRVARSMIHETRRVSASRLPPGGDTPSPQTCAREARPHGMPPRVIECAPMASPSCTFPSRPRWLSTASRATPCRFC